MDDKATLHHLEELAQRVGITVRYEPVRIEGTVHAGGYYRLHGKEFVIIHKKIATREKIHILIDAVKRHDLSQIYVLPSLRERLGLGEAP